MVLRLFSSSLGSKDDLGTRLPSLLLFAGTLPHAKNITNSVWELDPSQTSGFILSSGERIDSSLTLPLDLPIEEEKKKDYDPKQCYIAKLGEIFHDRYQVVVKVGFGGHSTVWLA